MRIGYPCLNRRIGCSASRTFRLASYSPERLAATVEANLDCLERMLEYNRRHGLLFLRITSDLVPFASHPICRFDWQARFGSRLRRIGRMIRRQRMRISAHPDQFTLINSPDAGVLARSTAELRYHAELLDLMGLDLTAKIQIHVGGVYGDRRQGIARFVERFRRLPRAIRRRLVVENDDRLYPVADCLEASRRTGVPVLFDSFHHAVLNRGEPARAALAACCKTWRRRDGLPMTDYSSQRPGGRAGRHAETIDGADFRRWLRVTRPLDFDVMLEIKDKERSALRAIRAAGRDRRLVRFPD